MLHKADIVLVKLLLASAVTHNAYINLAELTDRMALVMVLLS